MAETNASKLETVQRFFSGTGLSYDQVVKVCTSGFDPYWKRRILAALPPAPRRVLDQACGTGILTFGIARAHPRCRVTGVELREEYLDLARVKAREQGITNVDFILGRAEDVLIGEEFDCITSSYLAKYAELATLVAHAKAMLRPGGTLVMHDFTCPQNPVCRLLWKGYLHLLRLVGNRIYPEWRTVFLELPQFLRDSSWVPDTLAALEANGFAEISCRSLSFGTAALITAKRPASG